MHKFFIRKTLTSKSLYATLLFCICFFSAVSSKANSSDIIVIGYSGESSYLVEAATKTNIPIEEFMRLFPTDSLVIGQDDQIILLNATTGTKQTWNGPITLPVAEIEKKPNETDNIAEQEQLPLAVANEAREILHSRAGGIIMRGAGKKQKARILSARKYEQLKSLLKDL